MAAELMPEWKMTTNQAGKECQKSAETTGIRPKAMEVATITRLLLPW